MDKAIRTGFQAALALAAATVGVMPGAAMAQAKPVTIRAVMHSGLRITDPIITTANIARNHGYMIYDTLFATDANFKVQPQMVKEYSVSDDKLTYTFTLRDGLKFHDGAPVTSADCIASIQRWGKRDSMGQKLMEYTVSLDAVDDKTFTLKLKQALRACPDFARQALVQRAVHHAEAHRRDPGGQERSGGNRLRPVPLREGASSSPA